MWVLQCESFDAINSESFLHLTVDRYMTQYGQTFEVMEMFALTSALILEVGEEHQLLREDKQA